jgi:Na+-transporting NADH:ubiquinone oxidoreductase subunit E
MENLVNIFVKSIFIDNMIFAYFLGMCSYLAVSKTVKTSTGLGIAVIFVLGFTVPINFLLEKYVLKAGALTWISASLADVDLSFLTFIMFIAVIASMVQLVEMVIEKFAPTLYTSLGIFLAADCGELRHPGRRSSCRSGNMPTSPRPRSSDWARGWAGSWPLWALPPSGKRSRYSNVPAPLKGLGITFIITGLMGIAFMSFMGISL